MKEERGTTKPAYCNKAPSPGRCGVVAVAGNLMTRVGLRSMADGLPTSTGLAKRDRPRSRANGKTKTRGNIAGQTKHLAICAKAFVPDAASRSDRTGPLVASGDAGDRLAIYFGTLMSRWSEGYFMTTSRLRQNAADGKPYSTFLELPWLVIHRYAFGPSFSIKRSYS
ncbi:hypothetical protein RFM26_29550 [Mesorhizobium sp. VK23B]|uniref:Uncharacterized protein n=1 Tax=Mesorhizobium dulcispinae TaxID=3072316 RepID=A0ABU4XN41_9HYPH|nr:MULTISPECIES: hypothetical protein [unclassified Mesorhizobium]MDX8469834.1 hypothetical protein [Mesorhizobium sp. VK23B]MDX8476173.1 hypothetical protein [Mesorhizobium sp. VK23A]